MTRRPLPGIKRRSILSSIHVVPILVTLAAVAVAAVAGWQAWQYYMGAPWTRDGTVRAYVVKIAPEVAGEIVKLPIVDNQFVHKGDLLMLIDPRNYSIAVRQAEATVEQTRATSVNANAEMTRRLKLSDIAVTMEERQTYVSQAATAEATYQSALANLEQARINFKRTEVRSPVNGYVTNLTAQLGDYANVGDLQLSVVNSDSYWVDAYFEETALGRIREGDAATIKLMGYSPLLRGRVQGLARGINVPNAHARRLRSRLGQSDLHLRAARSARAGAHAHRRSSRGGHARRRPDGDGAGRTQPGAAGFRFETFTRPRERSRAATSST